MNQNASAQPTTSNTGFSFGNNNSSQGIGASGSKPSLFGNSSTNPSFGGGLNGLGFAQSAQPLQQQQQQQQVSNPSPYGVDFAKFNAAEMPKSLTSASPDETLKLKRKRANSATSTNAEEKSTSLIGRIVDTFKTPSAHSLEDIRGLFTTSRGRTPCKNDSDKNSQLEDYSNSVGLAMQRMPAAKSEYRRLIIKSSKDAYKKYDEIDANQVLLSKRKNFQFANIPEKPEQSQNTAITSLKPPTKRAKTNQIAPNDNMNTLSEQETKVELTFSKPITEQLEKKVVAEVSKPVVSESDYWCSPSIDELSKLSSLELGHVENFSIGRRNHGSLMFKQPVDLTAFENNWDKLLGKTVIFKNRILQVYDEMDKPSQGNGMNVPAVVTIEKVFPKRYDPLNPDIELLERHIQRLKSTYGMKFISFDPLTGNYVFEVEHFSIWGIVDEEDDDPELVEKWQKQQNMEYSNEKRKNDLQINALEKIAGYGQPGDNWKKQKPDLGVLAPGSLDLNTKEAELDNEDEAELLLEKINDDENDIDVDASVPSGLIDQKLVETQEKLIANNIDEIDQLVEIRAYEPDIKDVNMQFINSKTELSLSDNWDEQLKLSNGFFSVFNKSLEKKNSIRLDPKNVGELIFGNRDTSELKKAIKETPVLFENSLQYQKCLDALILKTNFVTRTNGFPMVEFGSNVSLTTQLLSFENCNVYTIWELLSILYDDSYLMKFMTKQTLKFCNHETPKVKHILNMKRRELLCSFLQKLISIHTEQENYDSNLLNDTCDKIYHFICMDNLADAIQYAINTKNNHLAILLTMLDSNDATVHELAKSQLLEWANGAMGFIPTGVLKIYKLLMGDIVNKEYVNHLEGLSWPVVLYLMIKYGDSNQPLSETILKFIEYSETSGISVNPIYETYFSIFKLVNASKQMLSYFDVELQFLIMKQLHSVIDFTPEYFDDIVEKFSKKLEQKNLVKESLFVLEHLTNDEKNKHLVVATLENNIEQLGFLENDLKIKELNDIFHIPIKTLHQCRSVEFSKREKFYESTLELILADNLEDAHTLLLSEVAPSIIISNVLSEISKLEDLIHQFTTLSEFKIGAGIYADYIEISRVSSFMNYDTADDQNQREELQEKIESLLSRISSLAETTSTVKIAKTLMLRKLIGLAFREGIQCSADQLLDLELPESERNYLEAKYNNSSGSQMITN